MRYAFQHILVSQGTGTQRKTASSLCYLLEYGCISDMHHLVI